MVAIAIPVFTTQLEKSREATDLANIRSAYAEMMSEYLVSGDAATVSVQLKQTQDTWQYVEGAPNPVIGTAITVGSTTTGQVTLDPAVGGGTCTLTIDSDGNVDIDIS